MSTLKVVLVTMENEDALLRLVSVYVIDYLFIYVQYNGFPPMTI
jgi:hypothetical protein